MVAPVVFCFILAFSAAQAGCESDQARQIKDLRPKMNILKEDIMNFLRHYKESLLESLQNVLTNYSSIENPTNDANSLRATANGVNVDICIDLYPKYLKPTYDILYSWMEKNCATTAVNTAIQGLPSALRNDESIDYLLNRLDTLESHCDNNETLDKHESSDLEFLNKRLEQINKEKESSFKLAEDAVNVAIEECRTCFTHVDEELKTVRENNIQVIKSCIESTMNSKTKVI